MTLTAASNLRPAPPPLECLEAPQSSPPSLVVPVVTFTTSQLGCLLVLLCSTSAYLFASLDWTVFAGETPIRGISGVDSFDKAGSFVQSLIRLFEQWQSMVFYPLTLIHALLPSLARPLFWALHFILAGTGAVWCARRWARRNSVGIVAAIIFVFGLFSLVFVLPANDVAALAWMPWLLWSGERAIVRGGGFVIGAGLFGAAQLLSGGIEITFATWLSLCLLALGERSRSTAELNLKVSRLAFAVALVLGFSGTQVLPLFQP